MKRFGNLYHKVYDMDNLRLADEKASRGKSQQKGVILHVANREENLLTLHIMLKEKTFRTSEYHTFKIYEPKERIIFKLPYFPDRIVHHAIMNVLQQIFVETFTADTYSCIKGRGIHSAVKAVKRALKDKKGTQYCLKLDIRKFYPSIDHEVLKQIIRKKIKDNDLLWLIDEIIDSTEGLPIGNYLSQYLSNLYLTYFDHWLKEDLRVKYYFRYADDMVILSGDKAYLHSLLEQIRTYLHDNLRLDVKGNYQAFPVDNRSIDFLGYRFFHSHTLMRKSIKKRFARMLHYRKNNASIASYLGWAKHCESKHLLKKLLNE